MKKGAGGRLELQKRKQIRWYEKDEKMGEKLVVFASLNDSSHYYEKLNGGRRVAGPAKVSLERSVKGAAVCCWLFGDNPIVRPT